MASSENKGELVATVNEKATTIIVRDISHDSVKLQFNAQGMVSGMYNGGSLETVDIHQKTDGTFDYEAKAIHTTQSGEIVLVTGKGTGKQTTPTTGTFQGEAKFMTQSKNLSWLNDAKGWSEGSTNQPTNEATYKIYARRK